MALLSTFVGMLKRAVGLPGMLGTGAMRAVGRMVAPVLSRVGYRVSQVGSILEQAGVKYSEPEFSADLSLMDQAVAAEGAVPEEVRGQLFSIHDMVETEMPSAHLYRGFAKVTLGNIETGEMRETWISFYDDKRRSWDQWQDMTRSWFALSESGETETIVNIEFQELWHNKGEEY